MITKVAKENIIDAAKVYMDSWKESHKDICSAEFIEKHDLNYMINFLSEKIKNDYLIFISYDNDPEGIVAINPTKTKKLLIFIKNAVLFR